MVVQRLLGRARLAGMELDPGTSDLDARTPCRTGRRRPETERAVLRRSLLRVRGEERHVVEVVLDVGLRLDEPEAHAFAHVEVRLAGARTFELASGRQLRERLVERGDAECDVLQRAALAWPLRVEERELAAARIRADEREALRALDDVHPEVRRDE